MIRGHVVYKTKKLPQKNSKQVITGLTGEFYTWKNIVRSSSRHESLRHAVKHFLYTGGWKKFEGVWNLLIKSRSLNNMLPLLESVLSKVDYREKGKISKDEKITEPASLIREHLPDTTYVIAFKTL